LMDSPYLQQQTRRERIYIHRCRIYLQVATLSDNLKNNVFAYIRVLLVFSFCFEEDLLQFPHRPWYWMHENTVPATMKKKKTDPPLSNHLLLTRGQSNEIAKPPSINFSH
jgi:hypothetical protein